MRRKLKRSVSIALKLASFAGFAFSAICTFLGAAPSAVIKTVLGPQVTGQLLYFRSEVLNVTAEQARWFLVFEGDIFFGVALFFLFYVHFSNRLSKMYVTQGKVEDALRAAKEQVKKLQNDFSADTSALDKKIDSILLDSHAILAQAKKRERSARRLHNSAYEMLKKVRETKTSDL
jgi:hypothetical protein